MSVFRALHVTRCLGLTCVSVFRALHVTSCLGLTCVTVFMALHVTSCLGLTRVSVFRVLHVTCYLGLTGVSVSLSPGACSVEGIDLLLCLLFRLLQSGARGQRQGVGVWSLVQTMAHAQSISATPRSHDPACQLLSDTSLLLPVAKLYPCFFAGDLVACYGYFDGISSFNPLSMLRFSVLLHWILLTKSNNY